MPEGSVSIEGEDFDEESVDTQNINNDSETSESQEQGESPKTEGQPQGQDVKLTDKGTKLDPNPESAFNQQLANERARVREYERFMSDPEQVRRYLEDLEKETGKGKAQDELTPDRVQTIEDVQRFLSQERQKLQTEIEEVKRVKYGLAGQAVEEKVNQTIERDISDVQRSYPELRQFNTDGSPNPEFDPALEKELGDFYNELDFDSQSGKYKGSVSIKKLADRFMKAAKRGQEQGSKRAQTVVQDRREGRVITGTTTPSQPDESGMSASQSIAARIKRAAEARR
jgi:hypothetical protein